MVIESPSTIDHANRNTLANSQCSPTRNVIHNLDVLEGLKGLPDQSIDCVLTSPPYWSKRDYSLPVTEWAPGDRAVLGLEGNIESYLRHLLQVFGGIYRILKKTGTLWVVLGDTYAGSWGNYLPGGLKGKQRPRMKQRGRFTRPGVLDPHQRPPTSLNQTVPRKSLCLLPVRFAIAMIERGWILRNVIIWHKPNHLPESVKDRFASSWEYGLFFVKQQRYFFDLDAIRVPHKFLQRHLMKHQRQSVTRLSHHPSRGRLPPYHGQDGALHPKGKNPGDCWGINTKPFSGAHFAVYPEALCERPILAGCPKEVCSKCGTPQSPQAVRQLSHRKRQAKSNRSPHGSWMAFSCTCMAGMLPGIVLDPFMGSGTTAVVAGKFGRDFIGIERNPAYVKLACERLENRKPQKLKGDSAVKKTRDDVP